MAGNKSNSIVYLDSVVGISASELEGFFIGWPLPPSPNTLRAILGNSTHIVVAYDNDQKKAIGFVNCISDGILSAYIPLLEVLPEYQHRGIGSELIDRLLEKTQHYYMVDLCCDESLIPFYEKINFQKVTGMIKRNHMRQLGNK